MELISALLGAMIAAHGTRGRDVGTKPSSLNFERGAI
jgi:hypothetical protein